MTRRARLAVGALLAASVLGFFGDAWWALDLFAHFRLHYALLVLPLLVFLLARRDRRWALVAGLVLALNAGFVAPLLWTGTSDSKDARAVKLLVINVNRSNLDFAAVAKVIRKEDPDFVGLVEVHERWLDELSVALETYPYRAAVPRDDNFGVALYSRYALVLDDVIPQPITEFPTVRAIAMVHGMRLQVAVLHLPPPIGPDWSRARDRHLQQWAKMRQSSTGRFVLMGDFNATPWSAAFRRVLRDAGMRRAGPGIAATWPSALGIFGIPIDHVLIDGQLAPRGVKVGPDVGSDHRPLIVEISLLPDRAGPGALPRSGDGAIGERVAVPVQRRRREEQR